MILMILVWLSFLYIFYARTILSVKSLLPSEYKFFLTILNLLSWWYSIVKIINSPSVAVFCTQFYTPWQIVLTFWVLLLHKTDHFLSLSVIQMALSWNISTYRLLITCTIIRGNIHIVLLSHLTSTQEQPQMANYYDSYSF